MSAKHTEDLKVEKRPEQPSQLQIEKFLKLMAAILKRAQSEQEEELEKAS